MTKVLEELTRYESLFGTPSDVVLRRVLVHGEERYQVVASNRAWLFDNYFRATDKVRELKEDDLKRYNNRAYLLTHTV